MESLFFKAVTLADLMTTIGHNIDSFIVLSALTNKNKT